MPKYPTEVLHGDGGYRAGVRARDALGEAFDPREDPSPSRPRSGFAGKLPWKPDGFIDHDVNEPMNSGTYRKRGFPGGAGKLLDGIGSAWRDPQSRKARFLLGQIAERSGFGITHKVKTGLDIAEGLGLVPDWFKDQFPAAFAAQAGYEMPSGWYLVSDCGGPIGPVNRYSSNIDFEPIAGAICTGLQAVGGNPVWPADIPTAHNRVVLFDFYAPEINRWRTYQTWGTPYPAANSAVRNWPASYQVPAARVGFDPLTMPIFAPTVVEAIPYALIPYRQPNPQRSPVEQTLRGHSVRPQTQTRTKTRMSIIPPLPPVRTTYPYPEPPPPFVKERKFIASISQKHVVARIANVVTESNDAINALYDALPDNVKRKWHGRLTTRLAVIFQNLDKMDWSQALTNLLTNEIEDRAIGTIGRVTGKASRAAGRPVGYGTGPTF